MPRVVLKHFIWKLSNCFIQAFSTNHVLDPYKKMGRTVELNICILVAWRFSKPGRCCHDTAPMHTLISSVVEISFPSEGVQTFAAVNLFKGYTIEFNICAVPICGQNFGFLSVILSVLATALHRRVTSSDTTSCKVLQQNLNSFTIPILHKTHYMSNKLCCKILQPPTHTHTHQDFGTHFQLKHSLITIVCSSLNQEWINAYLNSSTSWCYASYKLWLPWSQGIHWLQKQQPSSAASLRTLTIPHLHQFSSYRYSFQLHAVLMCNVQRNQLHPTVHGIWVSTCYDHKKVNSNLVLSVLKFLLHIFLSSSSISLELFSACLFLLHILAWSNAIFYHTP